MEAILILVLIALVILALMKWRDAASRLDRLESRLVDLEVFARRGQEENRPAELKPAVPPPLPSEPSIFTAEQSRPVEETVEAVPPVAQSATIIAQPPTSAAAPATEPPPFPPFVEAPAVTTPVSSRSLEINWESFLGVKLFAWLGGLALFLGVAFFVKYSFERNLISPEMRIAIGYVVGAGLFATGLLMPRARQVVTAQTLTATGVLVLYAVSFAAHSYYHLFGMPLTFGLMSAVTVMAFLAAGQLEAQVVAILGLLGGFLTPPLLSTGVDNPAGLFGYLALLDAGLIAVALRRRWNYQLALAAVATVAMQFGWVDKFYAPHKLPIAVAVFLGFAVLFLAGFLVARRTDRVERWSCAATLLMPAAALLFALSLLFRPFPELAQRQFLLFAFVFAMDAIVLITAWLRDELRPASGAAGGAVFLFLTGWTIRYLTADLLNFALAFYLLFAVLHSVFPLVLEKLRPTRQRIDWIHVFPSLTLALMLVPLNSLASPSFLIWPVVLLVDAVAIALAVLTASLLSILAVVILTTLATALWIFQTPAQLPALPGMLVVIGGFALFFMAASLLAARKVFGRAALSVSKEGTGQAEAGSAHGLTPDLFSQMMSMVALLPFLLLTMVIVRLPLANPSAVFGLAALLAIALLGLVRFFSMELPAVVGFGGVLMVEYSWHFSHFTPENFGLAVAWHSGLAALFLVFPFLFRQRLKGGTIPWTVAALSLPLHFLLFHHAVKIAFPAFDYPGLVPALLAVPCALALLHLVKVLPREGESRVTLLALFGGATLFFVTLVFPIQFERQWLTISWALEGTALLWLFRRVPHPGLRLLGVALLATSFVRLALNPAVFVDYARSGRPILNWYLYSYGIVVACLMAGARLLAPPRDRVLYMNAPPFLYGMGTVLAFLLLNIEIADYFSTGPGLSFQFSASFAQDMTYSLAWGLFASALLGAGFVWRSAGTRYAGMGLLVVTLLKLFLHDLWRLGGLYRIGSLVGLALVLIAVSFIYQRFLSSQNALAQKK